MLDTSWASCEADYGDTDLAPNEARPGNITCSCQPEPGWSTFMIDKHFHESYLCANMIQNLKNLTVLNGGCTYVS